MSELNGYWNLDECIDREFVLEKLEFFKDEGKIEYTLNGEILLIEDIDLDELEVNELMNIFDSNDVFEEPDLDEDYDEDYDDGGYDDEW